ncbi:MAG: MEDS domain-containing protein [Candidatus Angelobacter sp.]
MSSPAVHSVHIYDEHSALIKRLCGIVASGLQIGNSVLIVATASHRDQLIKELNDFGVSVREHAREGRFTMYDAKETLATFMVNGKPDHQLFAQSVGNLLSEARKNARGNGVGLTVFGEMVAVLWEQGNKQAALELERLWNEALNDRTFHLHCAYPRWSFINDGDDSGLAAVCHAHSHVLVQ